MKLHMITFILLIIGGINWLLFAIFGAELGHWVLGGMDGMVARIVYILVGLAAVIELASHKKCCTMCKGKGGMNQGM